MTLISCDPTPTTLTPTQEQELPRYLEVGLDEVGDAHGVVAPSRAPALVRIVQVPEGPGPGRTVTRTGTVTVKVW